MTKEALIQEAIDAIVKNDSKRAEDVAYQAIREDLDLVEILSLGFSAGIREVGELFGAGRLFLPELILSAEVMKRVSAIFDEALEKKGETTKKQGVMVMATVEGDVHDIGKGIVISLVKTQGIEVVDLGRDVPVSTILSKAEEYNADIISTSALLTTTLVEQKKLETKLKETHLKKRFKTIVGGAPATQHWADRIGADAYAEDAAEAVNKALMLLKN